MLSKIALSYIVGFICVTHAPQILARPLFPRQATVTLQVLNNSVDTKLGCSAAQIATLQSALTDASNIASVAARTLSGVALSGTSPEAVTNFLGITGAQLADQTATRITAVGTAYASSLEQITDLVNGNTDQTLRFYCPAATTSAQEGNPCESDDNAATDNLQEGKINKMALCDLFFAGGSLASDTTTYNADKAAGKLTSFTSPNDPGITLIHEAQHSVPLLGGDLSLVLEDIAISVAQCAALPASDKEDNAENWALIAFLAQVDPSRFA
ncbi:hypothetical protein BD410DRAFT_804013 [Rickenella mellea]|uniref:Lysine-specific metallo-endopeptidase domain-containing protein n=1 Tax=Rickenella mellea TaxID=50990 RepID=A0A4Y7Q3Y4_9AGAM|nr:hypothetical protein BD410DRAFT_804013 [Rickenella mellea]